MLPSPPWNSPFFTVEFTLFSPCSRFDLPLSRRGVALAHLDSLLLTIWYSGLAALFLFLFAKTALAYLPTALCGSEAIFSFSAGQYAQVFLLKPASFCTLFADLGSTSKSATSLRLLSDSHSVLTTLSSLHLSFYLNLSGRNCLLSPPILTGYNGSPDTRFSWGTTWLMSWPDGERYLRPLHPL